ncbi:hypothetical protein C1646_765168 [Rhizophagus diaphanus]|nr:hypothetical protein C1646_765168 [Rhizophagus diaphanus] [Rhizophagus sp. MUCL 43196]
MVHRDFHTGKYLVKAEDINEELRCNILEFTNAQTVKKLNEILESRDLQVYYSGETTSKKVNEILESENSQTSEKVNDMLLSENLDDCLF